MESRKPEDIVEYIYTTENPETGSQPPEHVAWVMFGNGTFYLTGVNDEVSLDADYDHIASVATQSLKELGRAIGGTSSADFGANKLPWFPDEFVYMVSYNHNHIFNIRVQDEEADEVSVGFWGRADRSQDADELQVKFVRHFDGSTKWIEDE